MHTLGILLFIVTVIYGLCALVPIFRAHKTAAESVSAVIATAVNAFAITVMVLASLALLRG